MYYWYSFGLVILENYMNHLYHIQLNDDMILKLN